MHTGLLAAWTEIHPLCYKSIGGFASMTTGIVKCKYCNIVWEGEVKDLNRFAGLCHHILSIPPTIIALATAILDDFSCIDLLLTIVVVVG